MKKPSSKIREEIAKLQDQLRQAETREAERIGRIALRRGNQRESAASIRMRMPADWNAGRA